MSSNIKIAGVCLLILIAGSCRHSLENQNWAVYKSDLSSSSYSTLDQIDKGNVSGLEVAWTYRTGDLEEDSRTTIETNPLVVDGVLYGGSPHLRVFALDARTGEELWMFNPFEGRAGSGYMRGVVYWEKGDQKRLFFSAGSGLFALDAETGEPVTGFGDEGRVSLNGGLGRDPATISVKASSPGIIYEDILIMGSAVGESYGAAPGHIRAYDVRTGERVWTFHTIPEPGEPGFETWENNSGESLDRQGGVNNWAGMSLDRERGIVYIPLGSPVYDFYGGDRPGKNLYGNSLLALDAATGEYVWHFQTVHHDLWDYDLPAPPNLVTIQKDGKPVDAVAQITKQGFTFLFDRETGEPHFPVEEKPVPGSPIESEQAWPTQPFPSKPEPFVRQGFTEDDITDISGEAYDSVRAEFSSYHSEGLYTPPSTEGTILFPSTRGGANWGGAAHHPESGMLFINANETAEISTLESIVDDFDEEGSRYEQGGSLYRQHCSSCHGIAMEGLHPTYPPLNRLGETRSKEEVLTIIDEGGGLMPAFAHFSEEEKEAIMAFLFEETDTSSSASAGRSNQGPDEETNGGRQYINQTAYGTFRDPDGLPANKPPWGTLNAIDLNEGEIRWRVPLGTHPDLEGSGEPPTGMESWGGPIATAGGLVFIGGTADRKFRAFDQDTGELLWETTLPTGGFATPATYMADGKQYVVIAVGGGRGIESGDYYIAFTLPDDS